MEEVIHCVDCKYSRCLGDGESARLHGNGMVCLLSVFRSPNDYDFCSKGEKIIKCKNCGRRFDYGIPNFCPNCGARLTGESEDATKKFTVKSETDNLPDNTAEHEKMADAREKWIDYGNFIRQTEERLIEYAERLERLKEGVDGVSD